MSTFEKFGERFSARVDVQLFVSVTQVGAHRLKAYLEQVGDFLVAETFGKARKDFVLPVR